LLPSLSDIKKTRTKLGITQRKLASHLGVSQSTITKIESGRMNPSYSLVARIFEYLESFESPSIGLVSDIHVSPVVFVYDHDLLRRATSLMQKYGFKQLPVKDENGLVVGSIAERDVSRQILKAKGSLPKLLRKPVSTFMGEPFPIVPESIPIDIVVTLLQHSQAVLTSRGGNIHGIVTNADLVKLISK